MKHSIDGHLGSSGGSNCRNSLAGKVLHVRILSHVISSPPEIGRRRIVTTLVLSCLMVWSLAADIAAQQGTQSHRLLGNGLPNLSGGASQMELFRRLQLLSGAAQAKSDDLLKSQNADSDAMRSLQEAMQNLQRLNGGRASESPQDRRNGDPANDNSPTGRDGSEPGQNPIGSVPLTPDRSSPSGSANDTGGLDPSVYKRIAEQMGLPPGGSGNSPPGGGAPGTQNSRPSFNQGDPTRGLPGTPGQGSERQPGQRPERGLPGSAAGPRLNNGARPGDARSGGTRPGGPRPGDDRTERSATDAAGSNSESRTADDVEPPKGAIQSLVDWFSGRDETKSNGGQRPPQARVPGSTTGGLRQPEVIGPLEPPVDGHTESSGTGRNQQPGTGVGRSTPGSRGNRDDRSTARVPGSNDSSAAGNDWFPGSGIAPPRNSGGNTSARSGRATTGNANRNGAAPGASMPSSSTSRGSDPTGVSDGDDDGDDGGYDEAAVRDSLEAHVKALREAQRKDQLDDVRNSSKSLKQKLMDIAKLARSESDRDEASDDQTDSAAVDGLQSAFVDALQEATKGLAEHVDEFATRDRSNRAQRGRRPPPRGQERSSFGRLGRIGDRASGWFTDIVEPAAPPASTGSNAFSGSDGTDFSVSFELLLLLGIGVGFVFWMQQRKRVAETRKSMNISQSAAPASLNNRQDIVQAFHDLAARCPTVVADWWTHDRAAEALATSKPDVDAEVRQLAQLYEQARYLPDESSLTDEQLAAAKAAWLRCRKS